MLLLIGGFTFISQAQTVIISKYVEACSGTTPKVVELWNPTNVDIDMSSTPITVWKGTNGAATSVDVTINSGTLKAGEVLIVGTTDVTGTTCHTYVSESFTFNGDDALEVKLDGTITDIFGQPGTDPGSSWSGGGVSTANSSIGLKSGITTGATTSWSDPSARFEELSSSCSMDGFGVPPGGCPVDTSSLKTVPTKVSFLNYPFSHGGPSNPKAVLLTGGKLGSDQATVTAPSDYEISTTSGGSYSSTLNFTPSSDSINSTFYVRLKSGKALGAYVDSLTVTHDSVTSFKVPLSGSVTSGNDTIKVASYNLLQYSGSGSSLDRNASLRTVLSNLNPDILGVCEIQSGETGFNAARDSLFEIALPHFKPATFIQSSNDMSTALFYDSTTFTFVSNTAITTTLRDINQYVLIHNYSLDTFRVYEVHLKASDNSSSRTQRAAEVHELRKITDALPSGSNFVVQGDFNIYDSDEAAYDSLIVTKTGSQGHFVDPVTMPVTTNWNNSSNATYHSQSTRTRSFQGGATSGLDDRFDFIMHSAALSTASDVYYLSNSYLVYGNDGNHYDDSINDGTNSAVSAAIADALHLGSDHLPVVAQVVFADGGTTLPVSFASFVGRRDDQGTAVLNWTTAMEINNRGFEVERLVDRSGWKNIGFVSGVGDSESTSFYNFEDHDLGLNQVGYYRLKQFDFDGPFEYSKVVKVGLETDFGDLKVYPNPFNTEVTVTLDPNMEGNYMIQMTDISGRPVLTESAKQYDHTHRIELSHLSTGVYLMHVYSGAYKRTIKLIKSR